jgi:hypothetical protein
MPDNAAAAAPPSVPETPRTTLTLHGRNLSLRLRGAGPELAATPPAAAYGGSPSATPDDHTTNGKGRGSS